MILVDKPKLKFLLAGRTVPVETTREYRPGRLYSAGVHRNKSICRVQVVSSSQTAEGWLLEVRQWTQEAPVFLAANPGGIRADYTTNPARAARERDGSPIEAAADPVWLAKQAKIAADRDDLVRRERARQERLSRWRTRK